MARLPGNEGGLSSLWQIAREAISGKPNTVTVLKYFPEMGNGKLRRIESVKIFAQAMSNLLSGNECEAEFFTKPPVSPQKEINREDIETFGIKLHPKHKMKKEDFVNALERILRVDESPESERVYQNQVRNLSNNWVHNYEVTLMLVDLRNGLKKAIDLL